MSYSRRSSYCRSPLTSSYRRHCRSVSRSLSRSRSRSRSYSGDVENPGNNLYVTGLSTRIAKRELERHFSAEGRVVDVHVVIDPWTRESRGFGFVTMSSVEDADRCIKYLDGSKLEGRIINVEKARRCRGRTPTPGRYLGLKVRERRRSPSYSPRRRSPSYSPRRGSPSYSLHHRSSSYYDRHCRSSAYDRRYRSPSYSPHRRSTSYHRRYRSPSYSPRQRRWSGSPQYSFERSQTRSYSPNYRRQRSISPYNGRERSSYSLDCRHSRFASPHYSRRRYDSTDEKRGGESFSRSCARSPVPIHLSAVATPRARSRRRRSSLHRASITPEWSARSYSPRNRPPTMD